MVLFSSFLQLKHLCSCQKTPEAVSPTVEKGETNNKTELFRSKFCPKNRAFPEHFKKENIARTACLPLSCSIDSQTPETSRKSMILRVLV